DRQDGKIHLKAGLGTIGIIEIDRLQRHGLTGADGLGDLLLEEFFFGSHLNMPSAQARTVQSGVLFSSNYPNTARRRGHLRHPAESRLVEDRDPLLIEKFPETAYQLFGEK